jgi:hypothetical protein
MKAMLLSTVLVDDQTCNSVFHVTMTLSNVLVNGRTYVCQLSPLGQNITAPVNVSFFLPSALVDGQT